jgi:hypothetical protein
MISIRVCVGCLLAVHFCPVHVLSDQTPAIIAQRRLPFLSTPNLSDSIPPTPPPAETAQPIHYADADETRSARYAATVAIDTNLAGRTLNIYKTFDHAATNYVRNPSCWAYGFDLACVAAWHSPLDQYDNNTNQRRGGTLVSPRHLLYANHYQIPHGTQVRFVTKDNTVITRVVSNSLTITGTDLHIGVLDADVPTNFIGFAKVLPAGYTNYFPTSLNSIPTLCLNQQQQALVTDILSLSPAVTNAAWLQLIAPTAATRKLFYGDKISGDSGQPCFLILHGELVVLTVFTGGGAGSGQFVASYTGPINATMQTLGGGYKLTSVDLSRFKRYEGHQ